MLKKRIKNRALTAMITACIMSFALVLVAWIGLNKTDRIITQIESESLPDIRVALRLAEGVAQLTALAPNVSLTNQPSLLNQLQIRLQQRFDKLFEIVKIISDDEFKTKLLQQLNAIQKSSLQLITVEQQNLFLSEKLLSRRYQLKFSAFKNELGRFSSNIPALQEIDYLIDFLIDPGAYQNDLIVNILNELPEQKTENSKELLAFLNFAKENVSDRANNDKRKRFLLVSMRVQSESLSNFVNLFANSIQDKVLTQQQQAHALIKQVFWGMLVMMVLLIITVVTNYGSNLRVLNDLTTVTDDMVRLSNGEMREGRVLKQSQDEVGELFKAYLIFQAHTLQIQKASNDLEQQKLLLETIFNSMNDGLSVFSADNRLLTWNKNYLNLLGLTEQDIYPQMPLEDIIQLISRAGEEFKDINGHFIDIHQWTIKRHNSSQFVERHDQAGRTIEFRSQPMPNGGFITLIQDLTYRRETELQLQQAIKMEVLGKLTGGVSHDFNNFLTTILGNLQLLELQPGLNDRQRKYLNRALKATEKGSELIKKLLAFSHNRFLEPELVNLDESIKDITDLLQYSVSDGIQFIFDLGNINKQVKIDRIQFQNALLNLTLNANAAIADQGSIKISTRIICKQNISWIRVSVADNGKGIPYEIQHRVFEAFFTTKEIGAGTGLGLSSVHGYVQRSGGEIGIKSKPNEGTTVWMEWPVEVQSFPTSKIVVSSAEEKIAPRVLLLVEDDPQVAETMKDFLAIKFSDVKHFSSADRAWYWITRNHIKIIGILSDVHLLNSISGIELRDKVQYKYPELPYFLYSGMAKEAIEKQFDCKIECNFINKPVTYKDIANITIGKNDDGAKGDI
ncbi:MAG TPA: PAS-domain containing protein [Psychromonas sp.]